MYQSVQIEAYCQDMNQTGKCPNSYLMPLQLPKQCHMIYHIKSVLKSVSDMADGLM